MFTPIDPKKHVDAREKDIQKFWEENDIFQKSVDARSPEDAYTFYDGPPFATGLPHYGHMVGQTMKDVVPRYWTMRGKRVERVWGWDCHGLPIENIVEKEMGSQAKKDIEKIGVAKFNELCRSKVLSYADEWARIIPRLGRWVDMENPYRTMDRDYMESVWWVFKRLYDKGLIYEDYRSMHICPRCETTLSQSEVSEGYKEIKDLSVTARFRLVPGQTLAGEEVGENTFILAWTTTPWTLPGNVALAVGADIEYGVIEKKDEEAGLPARFIVAKDLLEKVFTDDDYKIIATVKGADLEGLSYQPLYDAYAKDEALENRENGWKVVTADFVTTDEGTGVVHIAPAFGEDDMRLGKEKNLPFVQHVGMDGIIKDTVGAPLGGLHVKPKDDVQATDVEVIKDLAHRGLLFHKEKYAHSYPHCWRCDTPLINYATSSWFVAVTKIKDTLLETAKNINWSPSHIKDGRFGKWLEGARDWSISRQRFWASVMPIWVCDACSAKRVFGSAAELEDASGQKIDDLHKHIVDEVTFPCAQQDCAGTMRRVPDVLDTWFDSGSMPYAQEHYPFEGAHKDGAFINGYPADFIAEGVDQTRAWFYYLHVLAGALEVGGAQHNAPTHAFKNVIVNGIVLAEDGKKMSKKLKNYPDPVEMMEKYGADALRLYLMSSPVVAAENLNFSERELGELARGLFRMLRQSYSFFVMYANVDGWTPANRDEILKRVQDDNLSVLDKWIVARLHELIGTVTAHMDAYELHKAARAFAPFVDDLSNWYIRRSRKRFWKSEDDADKNAAYTTLHYVLVELAKLMAPFTPFMAEEMYRNLMQGVPDAKESVHLEDYPVRDAALIDRDVLAQMARTRDVITRALEVRARAGIKVRQPLSRLHVRADDLSAAAAEIIKEEVNVKDVVADATLADAVVLDTTITPELKREGDARELIRHIQQARKKAGFNVDDRITLAHEGADDIFAAHGDLIAHETLATAVTSGTLPDADYTQTVAIDDQEVTLALKRAV